MEKIFIRRVCPSESYLWRVCSVLMYCRSRFKQHLGICGSNGNLSFLKDKKHFKFTFSPAFNHALFMATSVSISYPVSSSQSSTCIITLTFSLPFSVFALYAIIFSAWCTLLPLHHMAPLFSTLSPAFCLSKGRLLVPYQTLMNYERPLSSGLNRNTSHCLPASRLKQLREERYCNPVKKHLVL